MKKLGIFLGVFFALILAAILIIPQVVDVDKYRPQIEEAVNKKINGKLVLGKLALSLWGQIRIDVQGLRLSGSQGNEVVAVKDAFFHLSFLSLFSGAPELTFKMNQPMFYVIKNKEGKLNVMSLMKTSTQEAATTPPIQAGNSATQPSPSAPSRSPDEPKALPSLVTHAKFNMEITNALVSYMDQAQGLSTEVKDLNLVVKDLSLQHPSSFKLWADLNTRLGKTFELKGPAQLDGTLQPSMKEGELNFVHLDTHLDMDGVEMKAPGTFEKKSGIATHADLSVGLSPKEALIDKFSVTFHNAVVQGKGRVSGLDLNPVVQLSLSSNAIALKSWEQLIPMLKEYELGGVAQFDATVKGPSETLDYQANLNLKEVVAKAPGLKVPPKFDGSVHVSPEKVDSFLLTLTAPGNQLKMQGSVVSFTRPQIVAQVTSSGMDLDQWMDFSQPAAGGGGSAPSAKATTAAGNSPGNTSSASKEDLDAKLNPLRDNPILAQTVAHVSFDMKSIKANQVKLTDLVCKVSLVDLVAGIDPCSFRLYGGEIRPNLKMQLKPRTPTYSFGLHVAGFDTGEAIRAQMKLFKDTFMGKAQFEVAGQGASFNTESAKSNLNAKGSMKITDATFATIDVMKMVSDALTDALNKVGDRVPPLKGKNVKLPSQVSKYEAISSSFTIAGGKFSAPNFLAKALPNRGIDLKGSAVVGLIHDELNAALEVIDTYDMTRLKNLAIDQGGVKVQHVLTEGNSPLRFPIHVGCSLKAPCYSYTEVPEFLAKIALNNAGKALTGRAKQELHKQAESVIKKALPQGLPPALQDRLKGLFH